MMFFNLLFFLGLAAYVAAEPTVPKFTEAIFDDTGSFVYVNFDAPTDQMRQTGYFACSSLFNFVGSQYATCIFSNPSRVSITAKGINRINVGGSIALLSGRLRAKCVEVDTTLCYMYTTVATGAQIVKAPTNPIPPAVKVLGPSAIGPCDAPVIDLLSTTGSGGRNWKSVVFSLVTTDTNTSHITNFLNCASPTSCYQLNPPTAIPQGYLHVGFSYTFEVTVCNFLSVCGSGTLSTTVTDKSPPVVSIVGGGSRTVLAQSPLVVVSKASVATCGGPVVTLEYTWSTTCSHGPCSLTSDSRDPSRFSVPSYSLTPGATYTVTVQVKSPASGLTTSATLNVATASSTLVASIAGGSQVSVQLGGSPITLDGSSSYDDGKNPATTVRDGSVNLGFTYTWTCSQSLPAASSSCGLNLVPSGSGFMKNAIISVTTVDNAAVGAVYSVLLTVSDSNSRTSTSTVTVTITEPNSPVISVSSSLGSSKAKSNDQLVLYGNVKLSTSATTAWTVDDANIALSSSSLTPPSRLLSKGTHAMNLVLSPGALYGKVAPYTFSLAAGTTAAKLQVYVNMAPQPGTFTVNPSTGGIPLETNFQLVTSQWTDDDNFPLSYEFGYFSANGQFLTVQSKSEATYGISQLPPGSEKDGYYVTCRVKVFDVFGSSNYAEALTKVEMVQFSLAEMQSKISASMETNAASTDGLKQTISVGSSILNVRDCSRVTSTVCGEYNRENCLSTDNTCGPCKTGYTGKSGDHNSYCFSKEDFNNLKHAPLDSGVYCDDDTNSCKPWEFCDYYGSSTCVRMSQFCPDDCSSNGQCTYVDVNYGIALDDCLIGETTCTAVCKCYEGFYGPDCSLSAEDINAKTGMRGQLMDGLLTLTSMDAPSVENIQSWIAGLASSSGNSYEITSNSYSLSSDLVKTIVNTGIAVGVPYSTLLDVLTTLDTIVNGALDNSLDSNLSETIMELLQQLATYTQTSMVEGQSSTESVKGNFAFSSKVSSVENGLASLALPVSDEDAVPSSVHVASDGSAVPISVMSLKAQAYNDSSTKYSNPIRAIYSGTGIKSLTFVLQHSKPLNIEYVNHKVEYNVTCLSEDYSVHTFSCPSLNNEWVDIDYTCKGIETVVLLTCPRIHSGTKCDLNSKDGQPLDCKAFYTPYNTTCVCTADRRKLASDALQDSGAVEVVASSTIVIAGFEETMVSAKDFDSLADLKKVLLVLFLYVALWGAGLLGISICTWHRRRLDSRIKVVGSTLDKKKAEAQTKKSKESIKQYLLGYVDEVFPSVFRPQSPIYRLWGEISKHHRYIVLFTAKGTQGDNIRRLTAAHLLTVQAMLMFMMALVYDINFPNDNGKCATYTTRTACLNERSPFDTSQTFCSWELQEDTQTYECIFLEPNFNWSSFILLSVIVAVFTAPVNLLVDFLFDILFSPTADSIKVAAEESTVKKVGRRVSVGIRRASVAGQQIAENLSRKARTSFIQAFKNDKNVPENALVIPESAMEAQSLAYTSMKDMISDIKTNNERVLDRRKSAREASFKTKNRRTPTTVLASPIGKLNSPIEDLFNELCFDIVEQRRALKSSEQEEFDLAWGIDPTGEFSRQQSSFLWFILKKSSKQIIKEELAIVQKEARSSTEKLRLATDMHTGLEILHLFVLDLLGRDSSAAKIFIAKSDQDFRHAAVVTQFVKMIAWGMVVFLNLFFIYFSMLRGLERGMRWQKVYAGACLMQMWVEVVFYETTECACVHYFIPSLVREEVYRVSMTLRKAVEQICSENLPSENVILDVPHYLYVSTNVAKTYPDLLESCLIQSYHTIYPGEMGKKWRISHMFLSGESTWSRITKFSLTSVMLAGLQKLGASSPALQRILIHSLQPFALSGIVVLGVFIMAQPLLVIPLIVVVGYSAYKCYKGHKRMKASEIVPMKEEGGEGRTPTDSIQLDEDIPLTKGNKLIPVQEKENAASADSASSVEMRVPKMVVDVESGEESD